MAKKTRPEPRPAWQAGADNWGAAPFRLEAAGCRAEGPETAQFGPWYLVVIQSVISAARGVRLRWQHVERTGEVEIAG